MNQEERTNQIKEVLNRLIKEGKKEGSFAIFENPETEKFVQFAFIDGLLCDIPLAELSKEEENDIKSILGEEGARDASTGKLISYQKWFDIDEIEEATSIVEKIFIDVFKLPKSYTIESKISL